VNVIRFKVTDGARGASFAVHVVPRASKNEISGNYGDAIKVRLTAPPVEGAANRALIEFLAERLGLPERQIEIVSGTSSRDKRVCVLGMAPQEVEQRLAAD